MQFGDVLECCWKYLQCYVVGDLNVHLDDKTSSHTVRMQQLLTEFGLHDCISQPTHTGDHQLDVFVTRDGCEPMLSVQVQPPMVSDHSLIIVTVDTHRTKFYATNPCSITFYYLHVHGICIVRGRSIRVHLSNDAMSAPHKVHPSRRSP